MVNYQERKHSYPEVRSGGRLGGKITMHQNFMLPPCQSKMSYAFWACIFKKKKGGGVEKRKEKEGRGGEGKKRPPNSQLNIS